MNANANSKPPATQPSTAEAGLSKFDPEALKAMNSTASLDRNSLVFVPATMAEAMELAKLMACSTFVAPCLRNKPGDCLAVVLQSCRWGADPFAVGNKVYFVNERMAFEAQLVDAVLNTSRILDGRLKVEWDGEGNVLVCRVSGRIKGDDTVHEVWQEFAALTVKNSPLWKTSPRQQLGYYTKRMWARLHAPEVLLGIYTPDDFYEEQQQPDGSYVAAPRARPTRADAKRAKQDAQALDQGFRAATGRDVGDDPVEDEEEEQEQEQSGDQHQGGGSSEDQSPKQGQDGDDGAKTGANDTPDPAATVATQKAIDDLAALVIKAVGEQGFNAGVDSVLEQYGSDLDWLKEVAPAKHDEVFKAIAAKRDKIKNRGRR